jgi:hypothetical protein
MEIESETRNRFGHTARDQIVAPGVPGARPFKRPAFQPAARDQITAPGVPGLLPRLAGAALLAGALLTSLAAGVPNAGEPAKNTESTRTVETPAARDQITAPGVPAARDQITAPGNTQTVETGKVQFTVTRDGRWVAFVPIWTNGGSLITSGGFALYAASPDGRVVELVNTARGGLRVADNAAAIKKCSEGTMGGFRAPSPDPDDDRDGYVDEDWLDGVDNDNDGKVDEDFAAIGDQMIVSSYCTPGAAADVPDGPALTFQQEAYAWLLPHIDGTIMVSLRVKNVGTETLEAVRIGAFFQKDGPFGFETRNIDPPKSASVQSNSQIFICKDAAGTAMGLVPFPVFDLEAPWTGGYVVGGDEWDAALADKLEVVESMPASEETADAVESSNTRIEDGATVYALSPVMDSLTPGDVIRVDFALVAVDNTQEIAAAATSAYETYIGDGENRYLPPPVSMTPRVIWGTYRLSETDESETLGAAGAMGAAGTTRNAGVLIDIEPLGEDPVTPGDIAYFSGLGTGSVVRREIQPGVEQLMLRGEVVEELALKGDRIVLRGRLEDGEFFEVILRPDEGAAALAGAPNGAGFEAELYWKTEGRLSQDFLNSSPNPFRDATTISYEVPSVIEMEDGSLIRSTESLDTSVKVYNVVGRLVSVLVEEILGPGVHTTDWRAVDDNGNPVASGVYYVKLQVGKKYITKRLILLK